MSHTAFDTTLSEDTQDDHLQSVQSIVLHTGQIDVRFTFAKMDETISAPPFLPFLRITTTQSQHLPAICVVFIKPSAPILDCWRPEIETSSPESHVAHLSAQAQDA